jgi:hypothetical protein
MRYLLLLIPTCLIGGCLDRDDSNWWDDAPSVYRMAGAYRVGFHGPRDSGYAIDQSPSLDAGLVTLDEIGVALDLEAGELAAKTGLDSAQAKAVLQSCDIRIIDDYNFAYQDVWAAGRAEGHVLWVSLWARRECDSAEQVPADAPSWTVRAPVSDAPRWRYGYRAILPVVDHELGHVFYGPRYEH